METNVYANENEICSKISDGISTAAFPDPCWSPPSPSAGPILIPYPNTAFARNLKSGSRTVFIHGSAVAKKDVSYLENSTGDEPATWMFARGYRSHVITGKAYFVGWSSDVKFEGLNVCRHVDLMTHNHN
jgi:hypothetical protein